MRSHPYAPTFVSLVCLTLLLACVTGGAARAQKLPGFDFTKASDVREWQATHDVSRISPTAEGMLIEISGSDPYIQGPLRDYPAGRTLWLNIRLKSDQAGTGQLFFFTATKGTSEEDSVRFPVPKANTWVDVRVPMPSLGPGTGLRLDPPGVKGTLTVASIGFDPRVMLKEPAWPKPVPPELKADALTITSGPLTLRHAPNQLGGYSVEVDGQRMAVGNTRPLIGYTHNGTLRWFSPDKTRTVGTRNGSGFTVNMRGLKDPDGGTWTITQTFTPSVKSPGTVDVRTTVRVDQERAVVYLPLLMLHPGVGSFGEKQHQALFAGLEYMDAPDTSSSEADIEGPGSKREVPDTLRITFPLMVVQAEGRYVGLVWDKRSEFSAVFGSPDRLFRSGGHVMGVLFPGSDGMNRVEGSLLPYGGEKLAANRPLTLDAAIVGGASESVLPAVQHYVSLRGLPPVPATGYDRAGYATYAAAGWLDSKIGENGRYRHAYWPGATSFAPGPAADPAMYMDWAARQLPGTPLADRLAAAAKAAIALVAPPDRSFTGVSHVGYPVEALLYGGTAEGAERAREAARNALGRFEPDGTVRYRAQSGGLDYGRTHFEPHANGLTAPIVQGLLENATLCGDPELIRAGLERLRQMDRYLNTVPRGAQTWEVPLHTPDILASAHLVRCYTLGYELTGEKEMLEKAIHWAWTGVPFVYLVNPTDQPVGPYATTPVFGATQWKAPNWMGLPVQWCGLVYADALYRMIRHDPANAATWKTLADGIAASGVQQSYPVPEDKDLQGLLPDSFNLRPQTRNGVAINPGTVQSCAMRLYGGPEVYDFRVFRASGLMAHAPGAMTDIVEEGNQVSFTVQGWIGRSYDVLVTGCKAVPEVKVNGQAVALAAPNSFLAEGGRLILRVEGSPKIEITTK